VTISAAVSNLLSDMEWSHDLNSRTLMLDRGVLDDANPMTLRKRYMHSDTPVDLDAIPAEVSITAEGLYDQEIAPTVVRLGLAWQPASGTQLAADFHRRTSSGEVADPWDQRVAVGVQQNLWIFGLRAGYAQGSQNGTLLSGSLSIGPLGVGIAQYSHDVPAGGAAEGWTATSG